MKRVFANALIIAMAVFALASCQKGLGAEKATQTLKFFDYTGKDVTNQNIGATGVTFSGFKVQGAKTTVTYTLDPGDTGNVFVMEDGEIVVDSSPAWIVYTVTATAAEETVEGVTYEKATAFYSFSIDD